MNFEEYQKAKSGILAADLTNRVCWKFSGADACRYLNGQVTNDIASLKETSSLYAAVTNHKGKMEGDVWITRFKDSFYLDADESLQESLAKRLERYIVADDVTIKPMDFQVYHVLGENITLTFPEEVRKISSHRWGEKGWDLWLPADVAWSPLCASEVIWEFIRIENGIARWGHEMTHDTLPPEANIEKRAISYAKGCYIGQEVIARIKSIGHVNKHLCRLEAENYSLPQCPEDILNNEKKIGAITTAVAWDERKKVFALGIVQRQFIQSGQILHSHSNSWKILEDKS